MASGRAQLAFLFFFLWGSFSSAAAAPDTVGLVVPEPLSGPIQRNGEAAAMGARLAAEEINAAGGLLGKKVEILAGDSRMDPELAARDAGQAVKEGRARFILQHTPSAAARALLEAARGERVILVTSGDETDSLTGRDFSPYFFRACLATGGRVRAYAEFFKTKPWRKFYLLHSGGDGEVRAILKREIPHANIVGEESAGPAGRDWGPAVNRILASGAEVVFTGSRGADLGDLIQLGARRGVKARYATYFLDDPEVLARVGPAAVGSFVLTTYLAAAGTPRNLAFRQRWNERYRGAGHPWPTSAAGAAYGAAQFLFQAVRKAGSLEAEAVARAWEGLESEGLMGRQIMRACDHQIMMPGPVAEVWAKSDLYPFPFPGVPVLVPMDKAAVPLEETGNPRCR